MAIDSLRVLEKAKSLGANKTITEAQQALDRANPQPVFQKHRQRIRVEVWDKVSPLAGQPPEYWLNPEKRPNYRQDYNGGEIYCVYVDDNLVMVQPHDPETAGHMPMDAVKAVEKGNRQADRLAQEWADEEVLRAAVMSLLST